MGDITQKTKEVQQMHKIGRFCAQPLMPPSHAPPTKPLATPISPTAPRKHDTGGKRVVGDITQ